MSSLARVRAGEDTSENFQGNPTDLAELEHLLSMTVKNSPRRIESITVIDHELKVSLEGSSTGITRERRGHEIIWDRVKLLLLLLLLMLLLELRVSVLLLHD